MIDYGPTARVFEVSFRDWNREGRVKQEGITNVTVRVAHVRNEDEARASARLTVEELSAVMDFIPDGDGVMRALGPQPYSPTDPKSNVGESC